MPNMSRKTIHPLDETSVYETSVYSDHVAHKNVNTDTTYVARSTDKKSMFNNNEDYYIRRRSVTRWSSFKQTIITILMSVVSVLTYTFRYQTSWFAHMHNLAARVMLLDTWLLWKSKPGDKTRKLVLLCLVPLLLFGGVHILLVSGIPLAPSCHPNCGRAAVAYFNSFKNSIFSQK